VDGRGIRVCDQGVDRRGIRVGPHEAFYTHVTSVLHEKTQLAQKWDVVCGIFMPLTC